MFDLSAVNRGAKWRPDDRSGFDSAARPIMPDFCKRD